MAREFRVDSNMISLGKQMREADVLRAFQQVGMDHLEAANHGLDVMDELHEAFLLCRNSVRFSRLPRYGEAVTALTCTPRYDGLFNVRYYALRAENGDTLADACSYWSLVDTEKKRIIRPGHRDDSYIPMVEAFTVSAPVPKRLSAPADGLLQLGSLTVTRSMTDQYGHLNNTRYLDILRDFLPDDAVISELTMNYNRELPLGTRFNVLTDGAGFFAFERDGNACFTALVE